MNYTDPDHIQFMLDMKKIGLVPYHHKDNPVGSYWQGPAVEIAHSFLSVPLIPHKEVIASTTVRCNTFYRINSEGFMRYTIRPIKGMESAEPDKHHLDIRPIEM